ncbi:L,D-transpeptidase [Corynebacterium sp. zg-331]|nr:MULTISPECIES: Ig-like domain-containing protein [unclassified Corynebacterium]MBC3185000.1 L,D-transpeptidase [Corynebacterium sp. zg-331]MPV51502.1 L,D-transpeptidase family protein [Corynebacterium sp. zg331]
MVATLGGGLSACTMGQSAEGSDQAQTEEKHEPPEISVADEAEDVDPTEPVTVTSADVGLEEVTMTNEEGREVEASLSADGTTWTTDEVLGYSRTYTVEARDKNGETATAVFSTVAPEGTASVTLAPYGVGEVGVGQPLAFRFSQSIEDRAAAQRALEVTTQPKVEGAFYWVNNQEVRWRPENFWEPGTKIKAKANIYGKDLGGGIYGAEDNEIEVTIGDEVIAEVDDNTKTMTVYRNGEELRSIPVSLGSDRWPTPNGTYIIGDAHDSLVMDSETFGLSRENGGYKTTVKFATQMSYSGIYVHAAPWSVWAQGNTNTSHGCINVTDEAAEWFQNTVKHGDIVKVSNTIGGELNGLDGLGDWNIPWEEWKAGNAEG